MPRDFRPKTKGNKVKIDFGGGKSCTFTAGGSKRYLAHEEWDGVGHVMVNGEVRLADGTLCHALLEIDETSSGEHGGTGIFLPNGTVVFQGDEDCNERLKAAGVGKVFPYAYRYTAGLRCSDHHVGADGWSR